MVSHKDIKIGDKVLVNWVEFRSQLYNLWSFSQIIRYDDLAYIDCDFIVTDIGVDDHEGLVKARVNPQSARLVKGCGALRFIFPVDCLHKVY